MSQSEIDRFAADLQANAELRDAAKEYFTNPLAQAAAFANSQGYGFTLAQLRERVHAAGKSGSLELSDAELDRVAGGGCVISIGITMVKGIETGVQTVVGGIVTGMNDTASAATTAGNAVASTATTVGNAVAGAATTVAHDISSFFKSL